MQSSNKDYSKMSRNSTQHLEPCMRQGGKAFSLFSRCDGYLLCSVNTFWGCGYAWDVELLLTGIQAVYQRSLATWKDNNRIDVCLFHVNAKELQGGWGAQGTVHHKNIFLRTKGSLIHSLFLTIYLTIKTDRNHISEAFDSLLKDKVV